MLLNGFPEKYRDLESYIQVVKTLYWEWIFQWKIPASLIQDFLDLQIKEVHWLVKNSLLKICLPSFYSNEQGQRSGDSLVWALWSRSSPAWVCPVRQKSLEQLRIPLQYNTNIYIHFLYNRYFYIIYIISIVIYIHFLLCFIIEKWGNDGINV